MYYLKTNIRWMIIGLLLSLIVAFVYMGLRDTSGNNGLTKVKSFNYVEEGEITCLALDPSCGWCPGEVINKECFVDKNKLTEEELELLGF